MTSASPTRAAALTLIDRLDREVKRSDSGTASVGGITKAGNALEELLRIVAGTLGVAPFGNQKGIGDYAELLRRERHGAPADPLIAELLKELQRPKNRIDRFRAFRNRNNHAGPPAPLSDAKAAMAQLSSWLRHCLQAGARDR